MSKWYRDTLYHVLWIRFSVLLLFLSILALFIGPIVSYILNLGQHQSIVNVLNWLAIALVCVMLCVHVFPELYETIGWWFVALALLGFCLPLLLELIMTLLAEKVHLFTLMLALSGWMAHAVLDGAVLSSNVHAMHHHEHGMTLSLLIVLHRIPVGQLMWTLIRPQLGLPITALILGLLIVGTLVGYFASGHYVHVFHGNGYTIFQSLVAGSLLHVMLFLRHDHTRH